MLVSFLSFNDDNTKTSFQSEGRRKGNVIQFEDKSYPNTRIKLTLLESSVLLERFGDVQMLMLFSLEKETKGFYTNAEGLEFEYTIHTKEVSIQENKVKVSYTLFLNKEEITSTTFQVAFFGK
ncbi:MAG: DUF1934 domain-containing protein [Anaeroplasmataceae bacterium]|nr:DUF1934 domain-containing protein [Anaeroplasmataceae bacterium]